jgi:SAM-dependent methyltransferase
MANKLGYYVQRVILFYRGNFKNYGWRGVVRVTVALTMTLFTPLVTRLGPRSCQCPCCGWKGSRFMPFLATGYIAFDTLCPVCDSSPRHRAHRLFYEKHLHFSLRHGNLLYFAPERNLTYFNEIPTLDVKTSNYPDGEADYHIDILDMPFPDDSWDYIVCHRVVEHLSDDRAGMRAFFRVLKPGGFAVISVPIDSEKETSVDYGKPNPLENEHYYDYGMDFVKRIPDCFEVDTYRFSETFSAEEHKQLGLIEDFIFICRKPLAVAAAA